MIFKVNNPFKKILSFIISIFESKKIEAMMKELLWAIIMEIIQKVKDGKVT